MADISPTALQKLRSSKSARWLTPISGEADFSAGCQSPILRQFRSSEDVLLWYKRRYPKAKLWRFHGGAAHLNSKFVDLQTRPPLQYFDAWVPCRKCPVCLRHRANLWRVRAAEEIRASSRTWFATFTVNPFNRVLVDIKRSKGAQTPEEIFVSRHKILSRELTLYFKRIRKNTGVKLRFFLVAEMHKDGWPHYHALIHELGFNISKRQLEADWSLGFTSFKLVPPGYKNVEGYLTKYIAKQALARIRASLRYGTPYGIVKRDGLLTPPRRAGDCPF